MHRKLTRRKGEASQQSKTDHKQCRPTRVGQKSILHDTKSIQHPPSLRFCVLCNMIQMYNQPTNSKYIAKKPGVFLPLCYAHPPLLLLLHPHYEHHHPPIHAVVKSASTAKCSAESARVLSSHHSGARSAEFLTTVAPVLAP